MPKTLSIQSNFIKGLITEATGLNFPENACTATSNCVFTLIGDITRRLGINLEENFVWSTGATADSAISSFRWLNAGGDGDTQLVVLQIGSTLYFFESTEATVTNPISNQQLSSTINISNYLVSGSSNPVSTVECQYAVGNGYLFVYHPSCEPFYCTFNGTTVTATEIQLQIRDFVGIYEGTASDLRPATLTPEHQYNLQNQGWTAGSTVGSLSNTVNSVTVSGNRSWVVQSVTGFELGQIVQIYGPGSINQGLPVMTGTIFEISGNELLINVFNGVENSSQTYNNWAIVVPNQGYITTWFSDVGNYPSNSDIWWEYKDDTGTFDPTTTYQQVTTNVGSAPSGHYILPAFSQNRAVTSSIGNLTPVTTNVRPRTGTWFQGRVWYAGVDASQPAIGDAQFYTWTESIYFSQIVQDISDFGLCYQTNDPTSETLFDLLPSDGGVIQIQGCGSIYKLFPIQNGMLVFAANGIWFITGGTSIGFTASDYTITQISSVQSISSTSFVNVMGLPVFWNEEGIYRVSVQQGGGGGLNVEPMTLKTILTFYNNIPLDSKIYVRGDYNPITYVVEWVYRSTQESGIANRYQYDSVLCYNILNQAFYPYSISSTSSTPYVSGIFYINYTNSLTAPNPTFKYVATYGTDFSFAEERDLSYLDWNSVLGQNYTSSFTSGYSLQGKGIMKYQPAYVNMYIRNATPSQYLIQGIWDYAISGTSGKYSSQQLITIGLGQPNFGMVYKRHKIRGHGQVLQLNITSVQGQPFDFMGWTMMNVVDQGI